tara:strand:- start:45 stop:512 length:468 start_codon:yes stop_codon:yes gene_type:complete
MSLITNKISIEKWYYTKITHSNYVMKDIISNIFDIILKWINNQPELSYNSEFNNNYDDKFVKYIFNRYVYPKKKVDYYDDEWMYEYFDLKFSDDINELFQSIKQYTKSMGILLFHNNDTYDDLVNYIYSIVDIEDPYYDINDDDNHSENQNEYFF